MARKDSRARKARREDDDREKETPRASQGGFSRGTKLRFTLLTGLIWLVLAGGLIISHWIGELPDIGGLMTARPLFSASNTQLAKAPPSNVPPASTKTATATRHKNDLLDAFQNVLDSIF